MLLRYKLYLFTSTLSFQSKPQGKTKQEIAQNFFVHIILIYGRKGYPVTLTLAVRLRRYTVYMAALERKQMLL